MIDNTIIAAFIIGVLFGLFIGWQVTLMYYSHSHMKKLQDEFAQDRARIRAELDKARDRMSS